MAQYRFLNASRYSLRLDRSLNTDIIGQHDNELNDQNIIDEQISTTCPAPQEDVAVESMSHRSSGTTKRPPRRTFPCPSRAIDLKEGLTPTCSDLNATSMSDLRRHLKAYHFFVERCAVCKDNILNRHTFATFHGREKCTVVGKQPVLKALDDSYEALFARVATMSYTGRNSRKSPYPIS